MSTSISNRSSWLYVPALFQNVKIKSHLKHPIMNYLFKTLPIVFLLALTTSVSAQNPVSDAVLIPTQEHATNGTICCNRGLGEYCSNDIVFEFTFVSHVDLVNVLDQMTFVFFDHNNNNVLYDPNAEPFGEYSMANANISGEGGDGSRFECGEYIYSIYFQVDYEDYCDGTLPSEIDEDGNPYIVVMGALFLEGYLLTEVVTNAYNLDCTTYNDPGFFEAGILHDYVSNLGIDALGSLTVPYFFYFECCEEEDGGVPDLRTSQESQTNATPNLEGNSTINVFDHGPDKKSKNIFPNPFNESITVNNLIKGDLVQIRDINGKLIHSVKATNSWLNIELSNSNISDGLYILNITNVETNKNESHKLFKF